MKATRAVSYTLCLKIITNIVKAADVVDAHIVGRLGARSVGLSVGYEASMSTEPASLIRLMCGVCVFLEFTLHFV